MARPSQQQPTQTVVVLSPCLHVSYAAAFLCAARQRWRSRLAYLCCGQSSMPALERRHRTLLKLRRQAQESARARPCGQRSISPWADGIQQTDSLPQSTTPIIVPRRLTVYRSLPQSIW